MRNMPPLRSVRIVAIVLVLCTCATAQLPPPPTPGGFDIQITADAGGWSADGTYASGPLVVCGRVHLTRDAPWPLGAEIELQTVELLLPGDPLSGGLPIPFPSGLGAAWTSTLEPGTYYATIEGLVFQGTTCFAGVPLWPFVMTSPAFAVAPPPDADPRPVEFWKHHPEAWPETTLTIGGTTLDQYALESLLRRPACHWTTRLARQLVATRFNLASGADDAILPAVEDAEALLTQTGLYAPGSKSERRLARALTRELKCYNGKPGRRHGHCRNDG